MAILILVSCKEGFSIRGTKDPVIAKVGERSLFLSQLEGLVHKGISRTDSAAIIDGYIENWIRENLMIAESEKNVAADINLNKLVDDYRSSLLVYNYEKKLIDQRLDTIVTYNEKKEFYEMNKSQYQLSHPIFRCIIAKVPSKSTGIANIKPALAKKDQTEALFLIKEKAVYHLIDTARWMTFEDLQSLLPFDMIKESDLATNKVFAEKFHDFDYFVKIIKFYNEKDIPPFEYIDGKITKTILSERKIQLLKQFRQNLYEKGLSDKKFEIFKPY